MKGKIVRAARIAVSAGLAFCLATGSFAFAADKFTAPSQMLDTDDNVLKVTAHRAAQVCVEILGADLVATSNMGGSGSLDGEGANAFMGIFGSSVNENPDPYLNNFFYNYSVNNSSTSSATLKDDMLMYNDSYGSAISGGPDSADTTVGDGLDTSCSLYMRPQVIIGGSADDYTEMVAALAENSDEDASNDYDPYIVSYNMGGIRQQCASLKEIAAVFEKAMEDTGASTRYSDSPSTIADNFQRYAEGVYYYVQSKIKSGDIQKKKVAVISGYDSSTNVWTIVGNADLDSNNGTRVAQYLSDNTINVADSILESGEYNKDISNDQLLELEPDIIFATQSTGGGQQTSTGGVNDQVLKKVFTDAGKDEPIVFTDLPKCVYGMIMNTHENIMGIPFMMSYVYYDQDSDLNPAYMVAYFIKNFYHVNDEKALSNTVTSLLGEASLPEGYSADLTEYTDSAVESVINAGMAAAGSGWDTASLIADQGSKISSGSGSTPDTQEPDAPDVQEPTDPGAADQVTPSAFTDVDSGAWYSEAVNFVVEKGIMNGTSDTVFSPGSQLTRAQFVTMLARLDGADLSGYTTTAFTDVKDGSWYASAVAWAYDKGITSGTTETTFGPDNTITREAMAALISNYYSVSGKTLNDAASPAAAFTDSGSISSWASEGVELMRRTGIITGMADGSFSPDGTATRAQAAQVFMRMMQAA